MRSYNAVITSVAAGLAVMHEARTLMLGQLLCIVKQQHQEMCDQNAT